MTVPKILDGRWLSVERVFMINGKSTLSIKVVCIVKRLFTTKITKCSKEKLYEFFLTFVNFVPFVVYFLFGCKSSEKNKGIG
jgi:hypothetical protein